MGARSGVAIAAALVLGLSTTASPAATFSVNSLLDTPDLTPGDGTCATAASVCTLRAAIDEANATAGADTIAFSVAGTIVVTSMLEVTDPVTIDGTSAPGYTAAPVVAIDGVDGVSVTCMRIFHDPASTSTIEALAFTRCNLALQCAAGQAVIRENYFGTNLAGTAVATPAGFTGIEVSTSGVVIDDNVFAGYQAVAVSLATGSASMNMVRSNFFGLAADGMGALGNQNAIFLVGGATMNTIGGGVDDRNYIGHTTNLGIHVDDSPGNTIRGNNIGRDIANAPAANGTGISLDGASGNTIDGNFILYSVTEGIRSVGGGTNVITRNLIFESGELAIDLGDDGVTTIGMPALLTARAATGATSVSGVLDDLDADTTYTIELFAVPACDASGYGEAAEYLGSTTVTTNASGDASFLADGVAAGTNTLEIAATATKLGGGTSELSACQLVEECPTLTMTPATLLDPTQGESYVELFSTNGGATGQPVYTVTAGELPEGLFISGSGIGGEAQEIGEFTFTIESRDTVGCRVSNEYTIHVGCGAVTVLPAMLPDFTLDASYVRPIEAMGGTPPYTVTLAAGTLPDGITLMSGELSGTPTTPGVSTFTLTVTDANGCTGSREYTVTVPCAAFTIDPATLPDGTVGEPYESMLQAYGASEYTVSGDLPPGLTLDAATGVLAGTPSSGGTFTFTIAVGGTCPGSQSYAITIADPDEDGDGDGGCCSSRPAAPQTAVLALLLGLVLRRRRRS